jgi:hypothetical protein
LLPVGTTLVPSRLSQHAPRSPIPDVRKVRRAPPLTLIVVDRTYVRVGQSTQACEARRGVWTDGVSGTGSVPSSRPAQRRASHGLGVVALHRFDARGHQRLHAVVDAARGLGEGHACLDHHRCRAVPEVVDAYAGLTPRRDRRPLPPWSASRLGQGLNTDRPCPGAPSAGDQVIASLYSA